MRTLFLIFAIIASGCSSIAPGSDPVIVNAQRSISTSFDMVDTFLRWEHQNRHMATEDVTKAADMLRAEFPQALEGARSVLRVYTDSRSMESKADLLTWLATLRELESKARVYYSPIKSPAR